MFFSSLLDQALRDVGLIEREIIQYRQKGVKTDFFDLVKEFCRNSMSLDRHFFMLD